MSRSSRQSFLGERSEALLGRSKVAIVGLCGGGSHITQQLAHVGVGNFVLYDPDHAEDSNLNRMVGLTWAGAVSEASKVQVMHERILGVNPAAKVEPFSTHWQDNLGPLKECTAIFGCIDSFQARLQLEGFARRHMVPYIDVGMDVSGDPNRFVITGQVILSLPGYWCMRCMGYPSEKRLKEEADAYGKAGGRPQVVWPNGILASVAVDKFMRLLTPWNDVSESLPDLYTEFDGIRQVLKPHGAIQALHAAKKVCAHFQEPGSLGDIHI